MAMGSFNSGSSSAPMAEINTTPLVDVMLVLLIIFIITAPLMTHSVNVDLPRASSQPAATQAKALAVAIGANNRITVDSAPMTPDNLDATFRQAVSATPQVELHLWADRNTRYETITEVMSAARRSGIQKMGFITQPGAAPSIGARP